MSDFCPDYLSVCGSNSSANDSPDRIPDIWSNEQSYFLPDCSPDDFSPD